MPRWRPWSLSKEAAGFPWIDGWRGVSKTDHESAGHRARLPICAAHRRKVSKAAVHRAGTELRAKTLDLRSHLLDLDLGKGRVSLPDIIIRRTTPAHPIAL